MAAPQAICPDIFLAGVTVRLLVSVCAQFTVILYIYLSMVFGYVLLLLDYIPHGHL